jgi:outer membrane protein
MAMRELLIFLAGAAVAFAQSDPAEPKQLPLSLRRAVQIALTPEGSPRITLASETIKQADSKRLETRSALLPNFDGSVTDRRMTQNLRAYGFSFDIPAAYGISIPTLVGPFSVFDARASVSQNVFDLSLKKRYEVSKVDVLAAQSDFDATQNQVSEQVARAYLAALRSGASLDVARSNVELSEALLRQAEQQKDAGTGTGIEVTRASVQLANDKQRLVAAENDRRRAGLQLLKAMGLNLDADVLLTDRLDYRDANTGSLDAAITTARKLRAELKSQKIREDSAKLSYDATKAQRLPSVNAAADYGTIGGFTTNVLPTYTYGFSVHVPVYNGGRREAERAESLSQYRQQQTRTRDLDQQVELDVRLAFDTIKSAAIEVDTARGGVELAQKEVEQARRRNEAGVANSLEVTDAQTRLHRALDNQILALYEYNLARIDLASATGQIREYVNQ